MFVALLLTALSGQALAQSKVPDRQIPPSVLTELEIIENRFNLALAADCDPTVCFATGCNYVDHDVADRPRSSSLPGLGEDAGPGNGGAQEFLTRARCGFAHEASIPAEDAQALAQRLQAKVSTGWTSVSVSSKLLDPLPPSLQEPVAPEEPEPVTPPEPEWSVALAARELWTTLLPHLAWMIALGLVTVAGTSLIWAWRRVGRDSLEDRMLLAELARGDGGGATGAAPAGSTPGEPLDDAAFVAQQDAAWKTRLAALDPKDPDPELQALIRELLRSGDLPLLAKAVLRFPDRLPAAFPAGGELAAAKLELADYLKTFDPADLPSDPDFFRTLNRHALAAAVASQSDARIVRSLREDYGAAGLADLIGRLPARPASLLFALAPAEEQHELVRLLTPDQLAELSEMLLRSNRMDTAETDHLFRLLAAVRSGQPLPAAPQDGAVSDRGAEFDAVGALSVLLEHVDAGRRGALFGEALDRYHGSLPTWFRGILTSDLLLALTDEARTDLMLEVDVTALAAWISLLDPATRDQLLGTLPSSLRNSLRASDTFPSRARQLLLAERGRRELARGLQAQLARAGLSFEGAVQRRARGTA